MAYLLQAVKWGLVIGAAALVLTGYCRRRRMGIFWWRRQLSIWETTKSAVLPWGPQKD